MLILAIKLYKNIIFLKAILTYLDNSLQLIIKNYKFILCILIWIRWKYIYQHTRRKSSYKALCHKKRPCFVGSVLNWELGYKFQFLLRLSRYIRLWLLWVKFISIWIATSVSITTFIFIYIFTLWHRKIKSPL